MIKVLICGVNGKMGQEVQKQLDSYEDCILIGGFDKENTGKFTFPVYRIPHQRFYITDISCPHT